MTEPRTFAERLDDAAAAGDGGAAFGSVLGDLFRVLEKARDEEER